MKRKDIKNDLTRYTSSRDRRPGLFSSFNVQMPKEDGPAKKDKENRNYVLQTIVKHMRNGGNLDDILDSLCSDEEINKQFEYLKRNGIEIRTTFASWYKSYEKTSKQRAEWNKIR